MTSQSRADILETFKSMTLLELTEFVKVFEETFDVTAAAPTAPAVIPDAGGQIAEVEEQTEFAVVITGVGDKKIQVIKAVRELGTGLGLKEAKDLIGALPATVLAEVAKDVAEAAKVKLEAAGATVDLR